MTTITVSTSAELRAAYKQLSQGEGGTILLEAGAPYELERNRYNTPDSEGHVTITSADPNAPATFERVQLSDQSGVTFDGVIFDSSGLVGERHSTTVRLGGDDITIRNSVFEGGATEQRDGSPDVFVGSNALRIDGGSGITVEGSVFTGLNHAILILESDNVTLRGNEITQLQGDGIRMGGVQDVLIEGNHMHDMLGSLHSINHDDLIQFWGTNTDQNTERVTIRDNVLSSGDASYQMIFGHNEEREENGWLYEDIVIEGNVVHGAHHHMISLGDTRDATIRNNTVLWNEDAVVTRDDGTTYSTGVGWVRLDNSEGGTIENNLGTRFPGTTGSNGIITYGTADDDRHHSEHFVNLGANGMATLGDLSMMPGSPYNGVMGAPMTWTSGTEGVPGPVARVAHHPSDDSVVIFDGRYSRDEGGALVPEGTEFFWTFADGSTYSGPVVTREMGTAGAHGFTLEIRVPGEAPVATASRVSIDDPLLLDVDFTQGLDDSSRHDTGIEIRRGDDGTLGPQGLHLDGESSFRTDREGHLYELSSFNIALDLTLDTGTQDGRILGIHKSMKMTLSEDGRLAFSMTTTDGAFQVESGPGLMRDLDRHEIEVSYDGGAGMLTLFVDGAVAAQAPASGQTLPRESWGLVLGHPWGGDSVEGTVGRLQIAAEPVRADGDGAATLSGIVVDEPATAPPPAAPDTTDKAEIETQKASISICWPQSKEEAAAPPAPQPLFSLDFDEETPSWLDHDRFEIGDGTDGSSAARLGRTNKDSVTIDGGAAGASNTDGFRLDFSMRLLDVDDTGTVLHQRGALSLKLLDDGRMRLVLRTDEDRAEMITERPAIVDEAWHGISVVYDGADGGGDGEMRLEIDGAVIGAMPLRGTALQTDEPIVFGGYWGSEADAVVDDVRFWEGPAAPEPAGGAWMRRADPEEAPEAPAAIFEETPL
ncbi:MAG: LamG-like jellyroll fold domain-containing protein [Hasllibacter sp.]